MKVAFSLNRYDNEGDQWDKRLFLHVGDGATILRFDSIRELENFAVKISSMMQEIRETNAALPEDERVVVCDCEGCREGGCSNGG